MRTLVLHEPGVFRWEDRPEPEPAPGEALLQVERVGICGTDLHAFDGIQPFFSYPRVLGHEICATVLRPAGALREGERVTIEPLLACGSCYACRHGKHNCCTRLRVLGVHTDGGMRPRLALPAHLLYSAGDLPPEQVAICEMLSIGVHANRRGSVTAGLAVVVVGAGPIGLGAAQVARAYGARVAIVDAVQARCDLAGALGCERTVNVRETDAVQAVSDWTGGDLADVVVCCVGDAGVIAASLDYVAPGGRFVLVGLTDRPAPIVPSLLIRKEIDLLASRNSRGVFTEVLRLVREGHVDLASMITSVVPFEAAAEAFAPERRATEVKTVVDLSA